MKYSTLFLVLAVLILLVIMSVYASKKVEYFYQCTNCPPISKNAVRFLSNNPYLTPQQALNRLQRRSKPRSDDEVPLKGVNLCGRNIRFPYFARNAFTASQRALHDPNIAKSFPEGRCRHDVMNGLVNESHSIVHENTLFYNLKYACLGFRINEYDVRDGGRLVYVTFSTENAEDIKNLVNLVLLNSLYVEFVINSERNSTAYRIPVETNPWIFSNSSGLRSYTDSYTIPFVLVENRAKSSCDQAFNNAELSPSQKPLTLQDFAGMTNFTINLKVFYIDPLSTSFQTIGRYIKPAYDSYGKINLFEKDYQKYYNDKYSTQIYEFMNNVAIMYANAVYPVFTYNFSLNINTVNKDQLSGNRFMIMKVYMDNGVGQFYYCPNVNDIAGGNNNNNMMGVVAEGLNSEYYNLHFFTGASNNCNFSGVGTLTIKLPYLTTNNYMDISITMTPNERVVMAKWNDVNQGDISKQIVFGNKKECNANSRFDVCRQSKQKSWVTNSLSSLFPGNKRNPKPLENIVMNYNTTYVKDIESVHLGYTNLMARFNQ